TSSISYTPAILGLLFDPTTTHDHIAIVKHSGLTWSDRGLWLIKYDTDPSRGSGVDRRWCFIRSISYPHVRPHRILRNPDCKPIDTHGCKRIAVQLVSIADDKLIAWNVYF